MRVISKSEDTLKRLGVFNKGGDQGPDATVTHDKGIVEVTVDCRKARSVGYFLFVLLAHLGHGICL